MAQSHQYTSLWWAEERIKATLDTKFIVSRLRPENVPRLFELPRWGEGLTSDTYLERILLRAGRLFLILDAIGIPDRVFALVDGSCDDDDLPIAEQNVDRLCLCPGGNDPALDTRFFHAQWRFLVRGVAEGEHVTYTGEEGVPVEVIRTTTSSGVQGRDETVDKVILAGSVCRVFLRTQVHVGGAPHFFSEEEVLAEIRSLRKLAHEHLVSIYASYFVDDTVSALFTSAEADRTLHSFLTDEPPAFKRLAKEQRRQTLITWPHCLASALSWLHARGHPHAAIRPSNVLVNPSFHIFLGQFQALDSLLAPPRVNDLEAYQYSAPERWVRTAAPIQPTAPGRTLLPSGGRTGRRKKPPRLTLAPLNESPPSSPHLPRPASAASSGHSEANPSPRHQCSPIWPRVPKLISTPSITSSNSSSGSNASIISPTPSSSSSSSTPTPTLLATWQSHRTNPNPSDLFSLAAITLDILTHLCKRSLSSFASHRSARNRSAGRGGGMADASFHLARNAVQVQSWIALLEGDALKRCRRDRGSDRFFYAVPRMLMVLRAMLAPEPEKRPSARRVRKCFAAAVQEIPAFRGEGVSLHCVRPEKEGSRLKKVEEATEKKRQDEVAAANKSGVPMAKRGQGSVLFSSSVSEFDFGFSDAGSDSERNPDEQQVDPSLLEVDIESGVQVE